MTTALPMCDGSIDDEHRLIARYSACLARYNNPAVTSVTSTGSTAPWDGLSDITDVMSTASSSSSAAHGGDGPRLAPSGMTSEDIMAHRQMIGQLEETNRQIMAEIEQLRLSERLEYSDQAGWTHQSFDADSLASSWDNHRFLDESYGSVGSMPNPVLLAELEGLKLHKEQLERKMTQLQQGRLDLMAQLDTLMSLLKERNIRFNNPEFSPPKLHNGLTASPSIDSSKGAEETRAPRTSASEESSYDNEDDNRGSIKNMSTGFSPGTSPFKQLSASSEHSSTEGTSSVERLKEPTRSLFSAAGNIGEAMGSLVDELQ